MCVKPPAHVSVSDKSIENFATTISSDTTKILSIGGFYFQNKVENLYLDMEYKGVLKEDEAKELLVNYVKGMIDHINKDESLKPYLIKELFDERDVSISLSYSSAQGEASQVHLYNGEIVFSIYDKANNALKRIYALPY